VSSFRTGKAVVARRPVRPDAGGDGGGGISGVDRPPTAATHVIAVRGAVDVGRYGPSTSEQRY